jgi:hypothetical protein
MSWNREGHKVPVDVTSLQKQIDALKKVVASLQKDVTSLKKQLGAKKTPPKK